MIFHVSCGSFGTKMVRINAKLSGFGPRFRIVVDVQNTGTRSMLQTPIVANFNHGIYRVEKALQILAILTRTRRGA